MYQSNQNSVFVLGYQDKFSTFENIGLIVLNWGDGLLSESTLKLFLLSCRVLGRGIEFGVLGWWSKKALKMGKNKLIDRDSNSKEVLFEDFYENRT